MRRDFLRRVGLALCAFPNVALMSGWMDAFGAEEEELEERDSAGASGPFPLPPGARLERDIPYGNDPHQRLDAYVPSGANRAPVIFMVHGGGWSRGRKDLWRVVRNKVTYWVGRGYVFVSTDYRMSPQADPVTQCEDVASALAVVQSRLPSWGGDPEQMIVMGHSSGAHLVALLTADPAIAARHGVRPWRASVMLDSAALNLDRLMGRRHFQMYDRVFGSDPAYWREASPTLRITSKPVAPALLVCSSKRLDSCPQAREYARRAQQYGERADVLPVDLTHPQINDQLGVAGSYTAGVDSFLRSLGFN